MKHPLDHVPPDDVRQYAHEYVRQVMKNACDKIEKLLPVSRERALFATKFQEALMWANACIAQNISNESDYFRHVQAESSDDGIFHGWVKWKCPYCGLDAHGYEMQPRQLHQCPKDFGAGCGRWYVVDSDGL